MIRQRRAHVRSGGRSTVRVIAAASVVFAILPAGPAKPLPQPGTNMFVFHGALVGELHLVPASDCRRALPHGVSLNINGKLRGSASTDWEIQVVTPTIGTFTLPEGENAGIVVSSSPQDEVWGSNSDGMISVIGAQGSADVELWSPDGNKIQLAGTWDCLMSSSLK
jgi:hypothetical protein